MKKLITLMMRYPIKILIITLIIMLAFISGITMIKLKTGNDTLISDQTDIYIENETYQSEFGKDPIILIFDEETAFDFQTLNLMNQLQEDIKNMDGIFSINSPVSIIRQMSANLYQQTESGLNQMAFGLDTLSSQLMQMSNQISLNQPSDLLDTEALTTNLNQLISAQNQLNTGLVQMFSSFDVLNVSMVNLKSDLETLKINIESDPTLSTELSIIQSLIQQTDDIHASITSLNQQENQGLIPNQTILALNQLLLTLNNLSETFNTQVSSVQILVEALESLSIQIQTMSSNLYLIQDNFNAFKPDFPSSMDTLQMMIFDETHQIKPIFENFVVNDHQLRMIVVLDSQIADEQIDLIYDTLMIRIEEEGQLDQVLVSGKPILDRSIKSSMTESMQLMMISAIIMMILILLITYRVRMRLLPIIMILFAVVVTIGVMGWLHIGLTMVSMAVFPVLIGLGIDYFIQFQTRYEEERG